MLLLLSAAWATCTFQATADRLDDAMQRAEAAYVAFDVESFKRATAEVDYMAPCLAQPLSPESAARLHRLRGIGYHSSEAKTEATAAFRAARAAAPDWVPPEEMFPEGLELRELYLAQPTSPTGGTRLPKPARGQLRIDGVVGRVRPDRAASLVQIEQDDRVTTTYLLPDDPVPFYAGANARRDTLLITGSATALLAGGAYGLAASQSARRFDTTNATELAATQRTTNALVLTSTGLGVAAVGQLAVAFLGGR